MGPQKFDSIGPRRPQAVVPTEVRVQTHPVQPSIQELAAAFEQPTTPATTTERVLTSRGFKGEFKNLLVRYAPLVLMVAVGLPLLATGTSKAMQQANEHKAVATAAPAAIAADPKPAPASKPAAVVPEKTAEVNNDRQAKLQALVNQLASASSGPVYLAVEDLSDGTAATYNADSQITSASLYKLFVANQIYRQIDAGTAKLTSTLPGGTSFDDCLDAMITVSDNDCGAALGQRLGWGKQNSNLAAQGFTHTDLTTLQKTSASDVALLYKKLYNGQLMSSTSSKSFLQLLKSQRINNRLPQGLPKGTVIAHKTGDLYAYLHDAGIVYGPKTNYVIVMMSGPWKSTDAGVARFADVSQAIWQFMEQ